MLCSIFLSVFLSFFLSFFLSASLSSQMVIAVGLMVQAVCMLSGIDRRNRGRRLCNTLACRDAMPAMSYELPSAWNDCFVWHQEAVIGFLRPMLLIEFYKPARDAFRNIARTRFRLYPVIWLTVLFIWFTAVLCRSVFPPMTSPEGALQFPTLYDSLFTLICKEKER